VINKIENRKAMANSYLTKLRVFVLLNKNGSLKGLMKLTKEKQNKTVNIRN
jgi:hypothetical protein